MRVVQLLAPGPFGGLERIVAQLCRGLSTRGYTVMAGLLVDADQPQEPDLVAGLASAGVIVHVVRSPHRAYFRERALVRRLLQAWRPDVVHTHGYHADVLLRSVAQRLGVPVVSTVHGFTTGGLKNQFFEWLERRSLRRMDTAVAVSNPLAQRLAESGVPHARLQVVRNAYEVSGEFLSREQARLRLGLAPGATVIGWVGRITPEKGPDLMLEAFTRCRTAGVEVVFVGQGPLQPVLEERAGRLGVAERVHWPGAILNAWQLFRAFDVYCLSSYAEGTPMALFEAMAAGVPVVTTAVGGVPDVVSEREALLSPAGNAALLAARLDQALQGDSGGRVEAAAERLRQHFGLGAWLDQYEAIYRALAGVKP